jgi:hypothetical protein
MRAKEAADDRQEQIEQEAQAQKDAARAASDLEDQHKKEDRAKARENRALAAQ